MAAEGGAGGEQQAGREPPSSSFPREGHNGGRAAVVYEEQQQQQPQQQYPESAYDGLSPLRFLTYSFVTPTVKKGLQRPLQQEDVEEVRGRMGRSNRWMRRASQEVCVHRLPVIHGLNRL
jgi:hypothetical protein